MNGLELIKQISAQHSYVKCIIVSGYDNFSYAQKVIHYGALDYLLKPINPQAMSDLLQRIESQLITMLDQWYKDKVTYTYTPDEIVAQLKTYVENNYYKTIDINTISEHFGFSSSYMTKIFSKHDGITPSKYIRKFRINKAKQLLADNSLSIHIIANAVGYSDPFHFSKSFKQETGFSPATYRKVHLACPQ